MVLELKQADKIDHSYDGRINHYGVPWRYESSRAIRLNEEDVALLG
ncbi:hypothetical protein [Rhizobium sp. AU243]|nr:hypothetical protein [Rhizobium sp. AU243]